MKIWVVTYSDGCETGDCFVEAYDDETTADLRVLELNEHIKSTCGGYSVQEATLNERNEALWPSSTKF
jgi:hypothetical protein